MAWITPPVFVALQTLTDSVMNQLSSRLSDLFPYTTIGDTAYASATDTLSRLGIGTAGQVLKTNSGATAPEWGTSSKAIQVHAVDDANSLVNGDSYYFYIPAVLDGLNLTRAQAMVITAGTTGATTIQIRNMTKHSGNDALSGAISIASGSTVGTVGTVDTSYDGVSTNDLIRINITGVSTTAPKGLYVILEYA